MNLHWLIFRQQMTFGQLQKIIKQQQFLNSISQKSNLNSSIFENQKRT
jgi:hypothetical protein